MKTIIFIFSIIVLFTTMGCKKESVSQKSSEKVISVNLNKSDTLYAFSFGYFGDEEGSNIARQAKHAAISEIKIKEWVERIFQYQPQNNYIGSDTVIIETLRGTDGGGKPNLSNKTIFIFKVSHF